ncbi:MAG: hypothetical protein H0T75_07785 [Rhizobiales bacterium]|nr:hypothetical protein [Hyphomicrobiales bacterium]
MASGSTMRQAERQTDSDLVGTFRRFGEHGVAYEVTGLDGEGRVHIRVVEAAKHLHIRQRMFGLIQRPDVRDRA